jgi:hypothetical protein
MQRKQLRFEIDTLRLPVVRNRPHASVRRRAQASARLFHILDPSQLNSPAADLHARGILSKAARSLALVDVEVRKLQSNSPDTSLQRGRRAGHISHKNNSDSTKAGSSPITGSGAFRNLQLTRHPSGGDLVS